MSSYVTKRELLERKEDHCNQCGGYAPDGDCEWCARFDAIMAEKPHARDLQEFTERLAEGVS